MPEKTITSFTTLSCSVDYALERSILVKTGTRFHKFFTIHWNGVRFSRKEIYSLAPLLFFLVVSFSLSAQSKQEVFEQSVEQFNITTIRYVLADDKQKPEAIQLAAQVKDLQHKPDTLIKRIIAIYGLNSKTQLLSASIIGFKNKFVEDRPLSKQLNDVIKYIKEDRKGKSYLPQLEQDLQTIEAEALEKPLTETETLAGSVPAKSLPLANVSALTSTQTATAQNSSSALTIAVFIIGLVSLVNLWLYYKLMQSRHSSHSGKEDSYKNVRQSIDFEIYPRLERNTEALEKKIENLRKEMLSLVGEKKEEIPVVQRVPESPKPVAVEPKELVSRGVAPGKVVEFPVNKPAAVDTPKTVKKYADYPKENGFVISQLQDTSDRRSIYEITIPPNSDVAQFTIVDNKELHEYAIQNRERLLKDACDFEVSSSLHTKIEVLRPGKLQKNGNTWQIRDKAQIKFV